jgi:hypothetical protein
MRSEAEVREVFRLAGLGLSARPNNTMSVSVARRASVAQLDAIVGPKT